jgi:hypothetical protein
MVAVKRFGLILPLQGTVRSFGQKFRRYYSNQNNIGMEREQLIEEQKTRAIDYWNNTNKDDALKKSVNSEVLEKLQQGLVPPIFHTLCRLPKERLFDPITKLPNESNDSTYIQLSTEPVTAGSLPTESEVPQKDEVKNEILLVDETSYLDSFFTPNGTPSRKVIDKAIRGQWTFNAEYSSCIAALVNEPAKMVGEDVEVTHLQSTLNVDIQHGTNLITRRLSRGIVGDCFDRSEGGSNCAIMGSSGIGKSWTLIYALQQALLYVNVCVLFYFPKYGDAIACIRKGNEVFVWVVNIKDCNSRLFHNSNVLVLLDPTEGNRGGANFMYGRRRLMFAAPNYEQDLGNLVKDTGDFKRILSTYSAEELKVALRYMTESEDVYKNQEVLHNTLQQANIVGKVPRYLVSDPKYQKGKIGSALRDAKYIQFQDLLSWDGIVSDREDEKFYENLFLIFAMDDRAEDNLDDDANKNCPYGYDGESGINYGASNISIISNDAFEKLVGTKRDRILSYWSQVGINEPSILRTAVLNLFWSDLRYKRLRFRTFEMKTGSDENICMNLNIAKPSVVLDKVDIKDLKAKCFSSSDTMCRMKTGTTLIDFAGPGKNVFHVAVGNTNPNLVSVVKELILASGHIKAVDSVSTRDENTCKTQDFIKVTTQVDKINLYWVIPYGLELTWNHRAARTMKIMNDDDPATRLVKECFNSCVAQFVLVMDKVPMQQEDTAFYTPQGFVPFYFKKEKL